MHDNNFFWVTGALAVPDAVTDAVYLYSSTVCRLWSHFPWPSRFPSVPGFHSSLPWSK